MKCTDAVSGVFEGAGTVLNVHCAVCCLSKMEIMSGRCQMMSGKCQKVSGMCLLLLYFSISVVAMLVLAQSV